MMNWKRLHSLHLKFLFIAFFETWVGEYKQVLYEPPIYIDQ